MYIYAHIYAHRVKYVCTYFIIFILYENVICEQVNEFRCITRGKINQMQINNVQYY